MVVGLSPQITCSDRTDSVDAVDVESSVPIVLFMSGVESVLEIGPGFIISRVGFSGCVIIGSLSVVFLLGISLAVLGSIRTSGVSSDGG